MDGAELFISALAQATSVIAQVRQDQYANVTPDTEWNVADLVGHMLYGLYWVADILAGKSFEDIGDKYDGDLIREGTAELIDLWQTAADKAEMAAEQADLEETAHLSYGDVTIDHYLQQIATDELVHAWDLGKSIGVVVHFDTTTAEAIYDMVLPRKSELAETGMFAPSLPVPETADTQTKLLGLMGRDVAWHPSA